jgi:ABC-2 type transport system permease protein
MNTTWVAFLTITRKEINRFLRIWSQTLLPPVITQSLYFVIFGGFIGSQLETINGISYMAFIVPGLVMMAVITSSYTNAVSSFFLSKFQRSIEELLVSPTPNWVIIAGYTAGSALRGLLVGVIVFLVSLFFVKDNLRIEHPFLIIVFLVLTAVVFSLGGLLNGIFAKKFDDVSIFPTFILTPLTYLGGVFYSVNNFSPFWQNVSKANPVLYMINGFRYSFYGEGFSDVNIYVSLGMLVLSVVVLVIFTMYHLNKGTGLKS